MMTSVTRPILSRVVDVDRLPDRGLDVVLQADAQTCAALAAANDLPAVARFRADLHVARRGRSGAQVTGTIEAEVTQICVVTLEPFQAEVTAPIDVDYEAEETASRSSVAEAVTLGDRDPPDLMVDGRIDVGSLATEYLTLSLDPHPRKPGVTFDDVAQPPEPRDPSPFAVLGRLKDKT